MNENKKKALFVALAGVKLQTAGLATADVGDLLAQVDHPKANECAAALRVAFNVLLNMNAKLLALMNELDPETTASVQQEMAARPTQAKGAA